MRLLVIVGCVLALPYLAKAIFYTSGGGLYYYTAGGSLGAIAASPILSGLFEIIAVHKNSQKHIGMQYISRVGWRSG